jgi:hypothetical protein
MFGTCKCKEDALQVGDPAEEFETNPKQPMMF